jgi:hypothetical protein
MLTPWRPANPPLRRPFTPEETRAIDQAIAAGKVQRIEIGGWSSNDGSFAPPLWRQLVALQFAVRSMSRRSK